MSQKIMYQTREILFYDWKGLSGDKYLAAIDALIEEYKQYPPKSKLVLLDVTDSYVNDAVTARMKEATKNSASKALAVVGVTGIKRLIANAIKKDAYFAKDLDDAKKWLADQ